MGGGDPNNDGRFVSGVAPGATGQTPGFGTSILDFIRGYDGRKPFCLFASLVNPHDIEFMPNGWDRAGYRAEDFAELGVALPPNFEDGLETKPTIQGLVRDIKNGTAPLTDERWRLRYVNFYAYLQTVVDRHVMAILDALDARGFTEDTVILRFADHGELGLSHGMREKSWTAYDEMIHVPLIVSCPAWYPSSRETEALYSHVDLLPTVARIAGVPQPTLDAVGCVGRDLGPVLRDPTAEVQDAIVFAFQDNAPFIEAYKIPPRVPTQIRALREKAWTYAVYFNPDGTTLQHEMYDLLDDPGQMRNLAWEPPRPGSSLARERQRLHAKLAQALVAANASPPGFRWPSDPLATSAT